MDNSLAAVVGRNCRAIRKGHKLTQDDLARSARMIGVRWTASSVGDFESGRSSPAFATVLAVVLALQTALENAAEARGEIFGGGITLGMLVGREGQVQLTEALDFPAAQLKAVCEGRLFSLGDAQWPPVAQGFTQEPVATKADAAMKSAIDDLAEVLQRFGLTEQRLARRYGITPARLAHLSLDLWGRTFGEERDHRAGQDANQQRKGRASRDLRAELEAAMDHGDRK